MKLTFQLVVLLGAALLAFLLVVIVGKRLGLQEATLATICSAAALATSAGVASFALHHSRRNSQEPWTITFRTLHQEFWNDPEMAKVRAWICNDEAYSRVRPAFEKRLVGQVSYEDYAYLETFDRFCALMQRVITANFQPMSKAQHSTWSKLGYCYWLFQLKGRTALRAYVVRQFPELGPYLASAGKKEEYMAPPWRKPAYDRRMITSLVSQRATTQSVIFRLTLRQPETPPTEQTNKTSASTGSR